MTIRAGPKYVKSERNKSAVFFVAKIMFLFFDYVPPIT
jgi:hypothetical protein